MQAIDEEVQVAKAGLEEVSAKLAKLAEGQGLVARKELLLCGTAWAQVQQAQEQLEQEEQQQAVEVRAPAAAVHGRARLQRRTCCPSKVLSATHVRC
jgi:hypothetical protein